MVIYPIYDVLLQTDCLLHLLNAFTASFHKAETFYSKVSPFCPIFTPVDYIYYTYLYIEMPYWFISKGNFQHIYIYIFYSYFVTVLSWFLFIDKEICLPMSHMSMSHIHLPCHLNFMLNNINVGVAQTNKLMCDINNTFSLHYYPHIPLWM